MPNKSFTAKYEKKYFWSLTDNIDNCDEEPDSCKNRICNTTNRAIINGNKKCKVKNFPIVGVSTEKPPQSQRTSLDPTTGIAENKFVITVAPHKLIWPHGKTYPKKAVAITKIKIITPVVQVFIQFFE